MTCTTRDALANATFTNACVLANAAGDLTARSAAKTCCGTSPIIDIDNGCFNYCNITSLQDSIYWNFCMEDILVSKPRRQLDTNCFKPETPAPANQTGVIATTWTAIDKTFIWTQTVDGKTTTMTDDPVKDYTSYVQNSVLPSRAASTGEGLTTLMGSLPTVTASTSRAARETLIEPSTIAVLGGLMLFLLLA